MSRIQKIADAIVSQSKAEMQAENEATVAVNDVARAAGLDPNVVLNDLKVNGGKVWQKLPFGWLLDTDMLDQYAIRVARRVGVPYSQ